jgi:hypothetical protein
LLAFGRPITTDEAQRVAVFLRKAEGPSGGSDEKRAALPENIVAELCLAIFNMNEFVFID